MFSVEGDERRTLLELRMPNLENESTADQGDRNMKTTISGGRAFHSYQTLPLGAKRSRVRRRVRETALAVVNLCATAFGTGLLSLPYSMKLGGLALGLVTLTGLCAVSACTTFILSRACRVSGESSYEGCLGYFFGFRMRTVGKLTIMVCLFVLAMTYLVALVDLMDSAVSRFLDQDRDRYRPAQLGALIAVTFPFTLVKRLSALAFVSWVAVLSCFFIALSLLSNYVKATAENTIIGPARAVHLSWKVFYVLPLQALNFACHYIWCETLAEVSNRTKRDDQLLGIWSHLTIYTCYIIAGVFGYLTYGSETQGDVFDNLPQDDSVVTMGRIAAAGILLFSYPILLVPLRAHVLQLVGLENTEKSTLVVSAGLSLMLYISSCWMKNLTFANAVAGTVTSLVVYVYPGAMLVQMEADEGRSRLKGITIALLGVAVSVSGMVYTFNEQST